MTVSKKGTQIELIEKACVFSQLKYIIEFALHYTLKHGDL
jgi:hypothetical protein